MVLLQALLFGRILLETLKRRLAVANPATTVIAASSNHSRSLHHGTVLIQQQQQFHRSSRPKRQRRAADVNSCFETAERLQRLGGNSVRYIGSTRRRHSSPEIAPLLNNDEKWIAVYRFPGIRIGVLLARAKLLQTIASLMLVPYTYWQYLSEQASGEFLVAVTTLAVVATSTLMLCSRYFNRMIGVIAMSESNQLIRIGYLSFWGSRRNRIVQLDDALPLSEANTNLHDSVVKFRQLSTSSYLYLPTMKVEILDEERANLLFGDISLFNRSKKND